MNEIIINTKEIESIWEKDHLCFIKMKSGKVWLCNEFQDVSTGPRQLQVKTTEYITRSSCGNGLAVVQLSKKGKSE